MSEPVVAYKGAFFGSSAGRAVSAVKWPDIEKVYGKHPCLIAAPEGYEFTGGLDRIRNKVWFLGQDGTACITEHQQWWDDNELRLILRKKEEKKEQLRLYPQEVVARKKEEPKTYTAAEVFERYGRDLLEMYGYFKSGTRNNLIDYPGFAYTGKFERVKSGAWYLDICGKGPKQNTAPFDLIGIWLTLTPVEEALPRIVSYNLMDAEEFVEDEARYLPNEKGEMMVVDPKEVPAVNYYERQEAA